MYAKSRTAKSIKNSAVALTFYFVNLVLQFFSRKIFLEYLGMEVLGLNGTATNLLQFLNLAELGVGMAIACTLYKPIFENDTKMVNEIVSLQGWLYRRIAYAVMAGSMILMAFFPWIFSKMTLPLWYAYASFSVLLVSALLSYFVNYKQVVLSADQKEYKIQYSYKASMTVKVLCQILVIRYLESGYVWWLVLEIVFAVIAAVVLNMTIRKTYPYLKTCVADGYLLNKKYPEVVTKIKQLFFHKIGGFVLTQTTPLIIYAYLSLSAVALYDNYMLIVLGVITLMTAIFNSMNAGVGNLVTGESKVQIMAVFEELFSIRFFVTGMLCFGVYILTPAFVSLWIGPEYVMDQMTLLLMTLIMYIRLSRSTVDAYTNAYGLFHDIWAPVIEAFVNIGLSVLLGYWFGLHGILVGVFISLLLVVFCWKPYFLFRYGLKVSLHNYVWMYIRHLVALAVSVAILYLILCVVKTDQPRDFMAFFMQGGGVLLSYGIVLWGLLYAVTQGMRAFTRRFIRILIKRR